jgi:hypothetical protein
MIDDEILLPDPGQVPLSATGYPNATLDPDDFDESGVPDDEDDDSE